MDRWKDRLGVIQLGKEAVEDSQIHGRIGRWADKDVVRNTDGKTERQRVKNRQAGGWMGRWTERQTER